MKDFFRSPSLFFAAPLLFGCLITTVTFNPPAEYLWGLAFFVLVAGLAIGLDSVIGIRLPASNLFREADFVGTREAFIALALAWVILLFCIVDLAFFPIPLISDPTLYATFEGGRAHVRHISNLCWILPVVAMLCTRSRMLRGLLIAVGILFPILVLDRNRLFAAAYAFIVVLLLTRKRALPWKTVSLLGVAAMTAFGVLGTLRSGNLEWVPLPFSTAFENAPVTVKWLLLYISAGIFNFSAVLVKAYENADFLINQLVPFSGSVETLGTDIPLDAPTINIGTEYFPFLMAFGPAGAFFAALTLYAGLLGSFVLLRWRLSPFTLLIFLRMSYVCTMASFAPQAYTWTNIGLIVVCGACLMLARLLPRKRRTERGELA